MTPWQRARRLFPVTEQTAYLDHAGGGPISSRVDEAVRAASEAALHRGGPEDGDAERLVERARSRVAALLRAQPRDVGFVPDAQAGLGRIADGIDWRTGDRIALLGRVAEGPWQAPRARGVELLRIPAAPAEAAQQALASALDHPRTRLLVAPAVDPSLGVRTPLGGIGHACRERAVLFCVEASHALGCLALDAGALDADCLVADGHRFVLSLPGCGVLMRRPALAPDPAPTPPADEAGGPTLLGVAALTAAVDLLLELGAAQIEERVLALNARLRRGLEALRCEVSSPDAERASGIVCFRLGEEPAARTAERLRGKGFRVRATSEGVRVSPHFYIEPAEIDALIEAL